MGEQAPTIAPPTPTLWPGPGQAAKPAWHCFWSQGCQCPAKCLWASWAIWARCPPGGGVSPQLFSRLHHYQVPRVVDLPVQLVIVLLGVAFRSPVAKPLPREAQGRGMGPPPSPLRHTGYGMFVCRRYPGACPGCVLWSNCEALGHEWAPLAGLSLGWGSHLLMVDQGPLLSDILLGEVDGWKDREQVTEEHSPSFPEHHLKASVPASPPFLTHHSQAQPLATECWSRNRVSGAMREQGVSGTSWTFPIPGAVSTLSSIGKRLGWLGMGSLRTCLSVHGPEAWLTTGHSSTGN